VGCERLFSVDDYSTLFTRKKGGYGPGAESLCCGQVPALPSRAAELVFQLLDLAHVLVRLRQLLLLMSVTRKSKIREVWELPGVL